VDKKRERFFYSMTTRNTARFGRAWASILLLSIAALILVACGQDQAGQDTTETGDPDVAEEAADVAQESEELAEAAGEEIEPAVEEAGTAAAQAGEEAATAAVQAGEEIQEEVNLPQELTAAQGVTISELDDNLDAYTGQNVGVRGDVVEVLGPNSFQISDPSALGGDEVLVVGANVNTDTITEQNTVEVSGTARRFDLVVVEDETGLDLEDELYTDMDDNNAVIIAQDVVNVAGADE
jgi:hypothetical protein